MDADDAALDAADRASALAIMRRWAAAHPHGDQPQWLSANGELISPRRLVAGMEADDSIGRFWFACLGVARSGVGPVGFDQVLDAHNAQAIRWEAEGQLTLE